MLPFDQIGFVLRPLAMGAALAAVSIAQVALNPALAGPGAGAVDCGDPAKESELKKRETALLGSAHAQEHAQSREHKCRVMKGLETEVHAADPQALAAAAALPAGQIGQWTAPFVIPIVGVTAVMLNNGKVLFWSYDPATWGNPAASNQGVSYLWNPTTRAGNFIPAPENIWCGGQTILSDGRVFMAGGNLRYPDPNAPAGQRGWQGDFSAYTFNQVTSSFIKQPDMAKGRWYPTVTQLPDNTAIITGGYDETGKQSTNQMVDLFRPSAGIGGVGTITTVSTKLTPGLYPFQYVLPSGDMLQTGPGLTNSYLLRPGAWTWTRLPNMLYDHGGNANGVSYTDASATPPRQIIVVAGGKTLPVNNEWLDGYDPVAGWRDYPKWTRQRHNANTVILPDGKLLTVGGNAASTNYGGTHFSAELYNKPAIDQSGAWVEVAPHTIPAAYHSSALLLPNGTVLLSEDDRTKTAASAANHRAQIYSPPYLFKGARPKMGAPSSLVRGQSFAITGTAVAPRTIASAVLIAPAAVTHGNDMHQRFIKLQITVAGSNVQAVVPASTALVPPGHYMLFIVDSEGVPSIAKFVRIP